MESGQHCPGLGQPPGSFCSKAFNNCHRQVSKPRSAASLFYHQQFIANATNPSCPYRACRTRMVYFFARLFMEVNFTCSVAFSVKIKV